MSQTSEMDVDLCPEYDFTQLPVVARGQGRKRSTLSVQLDPDVAAIFPDSGAVNSVYRLRFSLSRTHVRLFAKLQRLPPSGSLKS
jgi:hypothetical protein